MANDFSADDMKEAFRMAAEDEGAIRADLKQMAREMRLQVLKGPEREEFFRGMSRDEFDMLKEIAGGLGPKGMVKLESLLQEAVNLPESSV